MGLPNVNIEFSSKATAAVKQGTVGLLALAIKDASVTSGVEQHDVTSVANVPAGLSQANQDFIKDALAGTPKIVKVVVVPTTGDYAGALNRLETIAIDTVAFPGAEAGDMSTLATWVKGMRDTKDKKIIAVLADHAGDHEGIVNLTTSDIEVSEKGTQSATQFTARIAGLLAGLPLTVAPTFRTLPEVDDVPKLTKSAASAKIDNGEFVLFHDGEKVKVARGMTSLTSSSKSAEWKKIKLVRIYDKVYSDIKKTIEDKYVGSAQNSYSNKLLLINAVNGYLEVLEQSNILDPGKNKCSIDFEAQKTYLKSIGMDVDTMSDQEIKEANTRDQVYLTMNIKALDAIEDVALKIII